MGAWSSANGVFGEGTDDRELLEYCGEKGHVFVTHDKKDFSGTVGDSVGHAGIVIYTDPSFHRSVSPGWQTDPVTV